MEARLWLLQPLHHVGDDILQSHPEVFSPAFERLAHVLIDLAYNARLLLLGKSYAEVLSARNGQDLDSDAKLVP
jgi:hypothetical protein